MRKLFFLLSSFFLFGSLYGQISRPFPDSLKVRMQQEIIEACRHAWRGYKEYAWGDDELLPITKKGKNWYNQSLLMTPVDAYDTFILLGMKEEADEAKQLIFSKLRFNVDDEVQVFEITIRLLAALQTAYELDGDRRFLTFAKDLADRLMPAFNTATGMPYRFVHLQSGALRDSINNPAEIGSLMMEFGTLSKLTGNAKYFDAAKKAMTAVYNRRSKINLVGMQLNVLNGEWTNPESAIGAYMDSYYEYTYKCWKLFGDNDFKKMWKTHEKAIKKYLISKQDSGWFLTHVNMNSGVEMAPVYGALDAFFAGLCAYSGDVKTARQIQKANFYMWSHFHLEPEEFNFKTGEVLSPYYILRPENLESCFYLYRLTGDDQYLWMAQRMVDDILRYCKSDVGFTSLRNVQTYDRANSMQSFFLAETMKYAYLIFAPSAVFDLEQSVFNTEAHPLKINQ